MPNGGSPPGPDALVNTRWPWVVPALQALCGVSTTPQGAAVYDLLVATFQAHSGKRVRYLPVWAQMLLREAEDVTIEARWWSIEVEAVIAYRSEKQGREASDLRHWHSRWLERQCEK